MDEKRERFEFELGDDEPYRYFKPVLQGGPNLRWSRGENFLALRERPETLDVYPHFAPDSTCHVCTRFRVPSDFLARGYDARVFLPPGYAGLGSGSVKKSKPYRTSVWKSRAYHGTGLCGRSSDMRRKPSGWMTGRSSIYAITRRLRGLSSTDRLPRMERFGLLDGQDGWRPQRGR